MVARDAHSLTDHAEGAVYAKEVNGRMRVRHDVDYPVAEITSHLDKLGDYRLVDVSYTDQWLEFERL